jgi:hypothetical protein
VVTAQVGQSALGFGIVTGEVEVLRIYVAFDSTPLH